MLPAAMTRLFIHAINVHQGGGAVLLSDLLRAIPSNVNAYVQIDTRMSMEIDMPDGVCVMLVEPTLFSRFVAERRLAIMVKPDDQVLCFGNLPPLFRLSGDATVFLQNRYLVDTEAPLNAFPFRSQIRISLERVWLRWRRFNASKFIVQTESMKRLASTRLGRPVSCVPFVPASVLNQVSSHNKQLFDFLYVATGEAHKNHETLIKAWCVLADQGLFPKLALTLAPELSPELCAHLAHETAARGLLIHNLGHLPHDQLLEMYRSSTALIYPSTFESFGLPLIEARQAGLLVLAPELDYVRDVIDPDETFDPSSPTSIARAVRRQLEGRRAQIALHSAEELLDLCLKGQA
jgi:glycosyltransferase involved in cell wall biosynthesis